MADDMSDMVQKMSEMIKNNEIPDNIKSIMNNLASSSNSSHSSSANNNANSSGNDLNDRTASTNSTSSAETSGENASFEMPNIDLATMLKIKSIMDSMNQQQNDPRANLLRSLKPYLNPNGRARVDQYIKLFGIGKAFELLGPFNIDTKGDGARDPFLLSALVSLILG